MSPSALLIRSHAPRCSANSLTLAAASARPSYSSRTTCVRLAGLPPASFCWNQGVSSRPQSPMNFSASTTPKYGPSQPPSIRHLPTHSGERSRNFRPSPELAHESLAILRHPPLRHFSSHIDTPDAGVDLDDYRDRHRGSTRDVRGPTAGVTVHRSGNCQHSSNDPE